MAVPATNLQLEDATPSWMNPSPGIEKFNLSGQDSNLLVVLTPEKAAKPSRRTSGVAKRPQAGPAVKTRMTSRAQLGLRAERRIVGCFAGRGPPKSPRCLAVFQDQKQEYYVQEKACKALVQSEKARKAKSRVTDSPASSSTLSAFAKFGRKHRKVDSEPMQVQGRKPRQQSGWTMLMAKRLPSMGDMPWATKLAVLSEEWKMMKGRGNIATGGQQATTKKSMAREKLR